jgi:hypothetical protein
MGNNQQGFDVADLMIVSVLLSLAGLKLYASYT